MTVIIVFTSFLNVHLSTIEYSIGDKVINYANKKESEHAPDINKSDLAVERYFIALKSEVDKVNINQLLHVLTKLHNLKTSSDDPYVNTLKSLSDSKFSTMQSKVNELDKLKLN